MHTSACHVVHNFSHIPFIIELLNTTPNMAQLQKLKQLIGKPTVQLLTIFISIHHLMVNPISIALSRYQHISNDIYLISSLLSMQMILLVMTLQLVCLHVHTVSPLTMMIISRLHFHLNHSNHRSLHFQMEITI